jgi:hypothetical protein
MHILEVDMKSYLKRLSLVAAVLIVAAVAIPAMLQADEWNLKTYISVSQPFQVPGAVLQPNTKYVFRRLDASMNPHVVRILNEDESEVITTFHAVSDYRLEPADDTVLTFHEVAAGYPKPVRTWFYPGRLNGLEFIYSKAERAEIAAHAPGAQSTIQTAALQESETFTDQSSEAMPAEPAVEDQSLDQTTDVDVEREKPSEPAISETDQDADVSDQDNAADSADMDDDAEMDDNAADDADSEETLPATAGELPLIGLLGLASLGLRQILRKR